MLYRAPAPCLPASRGQPALRGSPTLVDLAQAIYLRSDLLAQRSETGAQLFREDFRLFPSREVATFRHLVEMDQLGKHPLSPAARGWIELVREDAHGNRNGD